jgi:DNA-binding LacI/PurR family transcriptional regulator
MAFLRKSCEARMSADSSVPGITLTDLAQRLELSPTTVSLILNGREKKYGISEATAERVRQAAKQYHYAPNPLARGLRRRKTDVIGIILPHFRNDWAHEVMEGMWPLLEEHQLTPFVTCHLNNPEREHREIESLLNRQADGLICNPQHANQALYEDLQQRNIPLVFISDTLSELPNIPFAAWDPACVETVIQHLQDQGRKHIAYIGVEDRLHMADRRLKAYRKNLNNPAAEQIVMLNSKKQLPETLDHLLDLRQPPDALFCVYDNLAMQALDLLEERGVKVPQTMAIATLSDSPLVNKGYHLTTVEAPIRQEGERALQLMLHQLKELRGRPPSSWVHGTRLHVRATTA